MHPSPFQSVKIIDGCERWDLLQHILFYRLFCRISFPCKDPWNLNAKWCTCVDTNEGFIVSVKNQVGNTRNSRNMQSQISTITIRINLNPGTTSFNLATSLACSEGVPLTDISIARVSRLDSFTNCPIDISLDIPITKILGEGKKMLGAPQLK